MAPKIPSQLAVQRWAIFLVGLSGVVYEVVHVRPVDQAVLVFLGGFSLSGLFLRSKDDPTPDE